MANGSASHICKEFITNVNSFVEKNKIPAWIKPLLDIVKDFANGISGTIDELQSKVNVQKAVTDALEMEKDRLSVKLEDQLQYTRRNQLLIHGIPQTDGVEDTDVAVVEICKKIGVDLKKDALNRSHRLGRKPNDRAKKTRPVIVSFISYHDRKSVYDSKKN